MKKFIFVILIFAGFNSVLAQKSGYGIGIMLGEQTGLSGKYWLNSENSLTGGLAWSFGENEAIYIHSNYVWHDNNLIKMQNGSLPVYYGVGVSLGFAEKSRINIRIPLGVNYQFPTNPIDIFVEIVPQLGIVPSSSFGVGGAIGIRYFFL
jgi:hypothetical protein